MAFEYRNPTNGDRLAAVALDDDVWLKTSPKGCLVPSDRVEEVIAGIRDAARTAAARQTTGQDDTEQRVAQLEAEIARLHDAHKESLRRADQVNNELMEEVQRYAEGTERPVLWSVYNRMHNRALSAEAMLAAAPAVGQPAEAQAAEARRALYNQLMWPEWNPTSESHGTSQAQAEQLLNAYRAAILRERRTTGAES
ncbi:hypothetical protein [Streptomyces sp. NPDC056549]|uniref:hypothetical protein n=1 Tax=Streptomyces sp. NPDC056549 TaxID=3345864 RepID=UPI0036B90850